MERDKFMSPTEAKIFGLVDEVLQHPPKYNEHSPSPNDRQTSVAGE